MHRGRKIIDIDNVLLINIKHVTKYLEGTEYALYDGKDFKLINMLMIDEEEKIDKDIRLQDRGTS